MIRAVSYFSLWLGLLVGILGASPPTHCLNCEVSQLQRQWAISIYSHDALSASPQATLLIEEKFADGTTQDFIFETDNMADFHWRTFFGGVHFISDVRIRSMTEEPGIFELKFVGPVTYEAKARKYSFRVHLIALYPNFDINQVVSCDYYLIRR